MDTSEIKNEAVTTQGGIHYGQPDAPIKVVEFLNLRCPHCRTWWDNASPILDDHVKNGQVERIIKLYNKNKESLRSGNILHDYIDYQDADRAVEDIRFYIEHQEEWGSLSEEELGEYAKDKRGASKQDNTLEANKIIEETQHANVLFVPTVVIEDYIVDANTPKEEIASIIEAKMDRDRENRKPNEF